MGENLLEGGIEPRQQPTLPLLTVMLSPEPNQRGSWSGGPTQAVGQRSGSAETDNAGCCRSLQLHSTATIGIDRTAA